MSEAPVAIITAAGRGIGAACARELAARGHRVVLLSPSGSAVELANELGGIGVTGSVMDTTDLERLVETALDAYGANRRGVQQHRPCSRSEPRFQRTGL